LTWHAFKKGSGCKFCGAKGKRYKLFWMAGEERLDGVWIFIAQKRVDSVFSVKRHSKKVLILKMILWFMLLIQGNRRRKRDFWNEMFNLVSGIPQNETVVLVGDMNGHVEVAVLAMMGHMVVLGMEIGMQMGPGSQEFANGLNLVI